MHLLTVDLFKAPSGWSAEDKIRVNVTADLSFMDRFLLLWRPLSISVDVWCENKPGKTEAHTEVWASRWRWPWQHRGGYEAVSK